MDDLRHGSSNHTIQRIDFIDVARGLGIVFVLLGHNLWARSRGSAVIFNFHMPLFYFLSGLFLSWERIRTWAGVRRKILSILAPVPLFVLLGCLVFLVQPELAGDCSPKNLYGLFVHGEPWYDKPLWFFVSLAGTVFVFSWISRLLSGNWSPVRSGVFLFFCLVFCFVASAMPKPFRLLWSPAMVATVPFGLFWYGIGCFSQEWVFRLAARRWNAFLLLILAVCFAGVLVLGTNPALKPDLRTARLGSWRLFPLSLCGISSVLLLARAIPAKWGRPLAYVGRNTIAYFALEFVTFPLVAKTLGLLIPGYRHVRVADHSPHWQAAIAVVAQLAILTLLSPVVMSMVRWTWEKTTKEVRSPK